MIRRGYNHNSELEDLNLKANGIVSEKENIIELIRRCPDCKSRFLKKII